MADRDALVAALYEGLSFVSRQSRELGDQLHPKLPLVAHSLLMFVAAEPSARAVDVAGAYGLDKSTVSRQLAALESSGLLRRDGERPGRRGHVLQLTDEGTRVLTAAAESSKTTLATHLTAWDDEDIETLGSLLGRFAETSRAARLPKALRRNEASDATPNIDNRLTGCSEAAGGEQTTT